MPRAFVPLFIALAMRPFPWAGAFTGRIAVSPSRACGSGDCSAGGRAVCKKPACPTSGGQALMREEAMVVLAWKRPRPRRFYARWATQSFTGTAVSTQQYRCMYLFSKEGENQVKHAMPSGRPNAAIISRVRAGHMCLSTRCSLSILNAFNAELLEYVGEGWFSVMPCMSMEL